MPADIIDLAPLLQQLELSDQATPQQHQCATHDGLTWSVVRLLPGTTWDLAAGSECLVTDGFATFHGSDHRHSIGPGHLLICPDSATIHNDGTAPFQLLMRLPK